MSHIEFTQWPHIYREGKGVVLLALHGTGGTETDAVALADAFAPDFSVLAPRGMVMEGGMSRWFRRRSEGNFDVEDVHARASDLKTFMAQAITEYGLEGRKVIATGFSNGANMALGLGLLHPDSVDGILAFSGMYPLADEEAPSSLDGKKVLLLNGADDAMAPQASVSRLAEQLAARQANLERRTRPGGHGVTHDELLAASAWLHSFS